jgi:outer membrane protein, multidrug efflux system
MDFMTRLLFLLFSFLCGCQLEPPYNPPTIDAPEEWKYAQEKEVSPDSPSICIDNWWEIFEDPVLNKLEEEAIANNPGLLAVLERVMQAKDFAKIVRSQLFPQIYLNPFFTNEERLAEKFALTGNFLIKEHKRKYAIPFDFSYEVDLWSRYRNEYRSAKFSAEAQSYDYQFAFLILTTDLAAAYFQLRTQDSLINLFQTTIETRKKALSINQSRFRNKINNYTPVALSELDLSLVESQYEEAIRLRGLVENLTAVLIGISPSELIIESSPLHGAPPSIPSGTPSDILQRRPDLAAQERLIASVHAQIGVAYSSSFPSLELIGKGGIVSPTLRDFLTSWSSYWLFGANMSQYIFDAGARYYNVKLTWAEYREGVAIYKQKVLQAFGEVEDALLNLEQIAKEMQAVDHSVQAAHKAYSIAFHRYLEGVGFYLEVADDERQLLDNQRIYMELLGLYYFNTIQLIKALGGGWE